MKRSFLLISILFSSTCFAEASCLKLAPKYSRELLMCDVLDRGNSNFYGYKDLKSCFFGNASEVVTKINDALFRDSDEGISDAEVVNEDVIKFSYYNISTSFEHIVKRCE